jgi:hypothetical protein
MTIWDKIDKSVLAVPSGDLADAGGSDTSNSAAASSPKSFLRVRRAVRNLLGFLLWTYVFLQVFVVDVDQAVLGTDNGHVNHLVGYKFVFVIVVLVVVAIFWKRLLLPFLYIVFFPFIILFWKIPRAIYRRRSGGLILGICNAISSLFVDFRWNFTCSAAWFIASIIVLTTHITPAIYLSMLVLAGVLGRSYFRTIKYSFMPSRFVSLQTKLINKFADNNFTASFVQIDDELKSDAIDVFTKPQLDQFVSKLSIVVMLDRAVYIWAYQLDRYRQGSLPLLFSLVSYFCLFVVTTATLSLVNIGILHASPAEFAYTAMPSVTTMVYYSVSSLAVSSISQVHAVGALAEAVATVAAVLGPVILLTLVANLIFANRQQRQDVALRDTVKSIKRQGDQLSVSLEQNFEVTVDDAIERLQELGSSFIGVILFLGSQIPDDFLNPGEGI